MSLGIAFKGPEGIVLAADSRVTLHMQPKNQNILIPATFDNATKLLKVNGQNFVGAETYGLGAIGTKVPRTPHSFLHEFEAKLNKETKGQLNVEEFAQKLSDFFMEQWTANMPANYKSREEMVFLIGGFDKDAVYGKVFEIGIPLRPKPKEWNKDNFGPVWGGQREFTDRLINGVDPRLMDILQNTLNLSKSKLAILNNEIKKIGVNIPYPFLPLQDCVDLSIFLIRTTMSIQRWQVGIRGVGGAIDVATITRTEGFQPIQRKEIRGELFDWEES